VGKKQGRNLKKGGREKGGRIRLDLLPLHGRRGGRGGKE